MTRRLFAHEQLTKRFSGKLNTFGITAIFLFNPRYEVVRNFDEAYCDFFYYDNFSN